MPMLRIESHHVAASEGQGDGSARIDVACTRSDGARCADASLECGTADAPAVGYVTESADGRLRVTGWFPRRQFQRLREILARGGQLQLFFQLRDRGARGGYLQRIGLTGPAGVLALATATPAPVRMPARARSGRLPPGARQAPPQSRFAMPL